jgi:hypothetical protein
MAFAIWGIWHKTVQFPLLFVGVYLMAPACMVITLSFRKAPPGGGGGGDGGDGGDGGVLGFGPSGPSPGSLGQFVPLMHGTSGVTGTQNLHFFLATFPLLVMQPHATVVLLGWGARLARQRTLLFALPPTPVAETMAGAFLPCLRWMPRQTSGSTLTLAVEHAETGDAGELTRPLSK